MVTDGSLGRRAAKGLMDDPRARHRGRDPVEAPIDGGERGRKHTREREDERQAPAAVFDAFCASRLQGAADVFGLLDEGADLDVIVERARPLETV